MGTNEDTESARHDENLFDIQSFLVKADTSGGYFVSGLERFRLIGVFLVKAEFRRGIRLNEDVGQYGSLTPTIGHKTH